ncbi:homeobox domain-containing protein [Pilobolus umbonatus]|nr:homeobox domain-containing protein [Pilobolus umbonatus]
MTTFRLANNRQEDQSHRIKRQKNNAEIAIKPKRKRISPEQLSALTELFQQTDTPSHDLREKLAKKLEMTNREVQVWFQNRRAKTNRLRLQEKQEGEKNKVKFNYYEHWPSSGSSSVSTPSSPHDLLIHPDVTPIDILATAAAYVQQWDEEERRRHQNEEMIPKTYKSWRPWL